MEADKQRNGPFYLFHFNEKQVVISNNHFHWTRRVCIKALVNETILAHMTTYPMIIIIIIMSILMLIIVTIVDIMIRAVIKLPPVVWPRCWQPPRP